MSCIGGLKQLLSDPLPTQTKTFNLRPHIKTSVTLFSYTSIRLLVPEVGPRVTTGTVIQARDNKTQEEKYLGNVFLTPTTKAYKGSVVVPPFIFNLDIRHR